MSEITAKTKVKRRLFNFEFDARARGALQRLKKKTGWTKTRIVQDAIIEFEKSSGGNGTYENHAIK